MLPEYIIGQCRTDIMRTVLKKTKVFWKMF